MNAKTHNRALIQTTDWESQKFWFFFCFWSPCAILVEHLSNTCSSLFFCEFFFSEFWQFQNFSFRTFALQPKKFRIKNIACISGVNIWFLVANKSMKNDKKCVFYANNHAFIGFICVYSLLFLFILLIIHHAIIYIFWNK